VRSRSATRRWRSMLADSWSMRLRTWTSGSFTEACLKADEIGAAVRAALGAAAGGGRGRRIGPDRGAACQGPLRPEAKSTSKLKKTPQRTRPPDEPLAARLVEKGHGRPVVESIKQKPWPLMSRGYAAETTSRNGFFPYDGEAIIGKHAGRHRRTGIIAAGAAAFSSMIPKGSQRRSRGLNEVTSPVTKKRKNHRSRRDRSDSLIPKYFSSNGMSAFWRSWRSSSRNARCRWCSS